MKLLSHELKTKHFTALLKAHGRLRWKHRELNRKLGKAAKHPHVRSILREHGIPVHEDEQ